MIRLERHDAVAVVVIDRPHRRNALDVATLVALRSAIDEVSADGTRVLVLTGAGEAFCAGADLTGVDDHRLAAALIAVLEGVTGLAVPVIAAVDGPALGAGMQLAAATDLRVASEGSRFGIPAARLGLAIDAWTIRRLVEELGRPIAKAMLLGAVSYSAEQLAASGFVQRIGALDDALAWASDLACLAPLTIAAHKRGLDAVSGGPAEAAEFERLRALVWSSTDAREGREAFLAKRAPRFIGS